MADDQRDVIAFLSEPASYGTGIDSVERIETHISLIFLVDNCAYKLKRAVTFPYLDFSTAPLRAGACAAELALNRRTAPELYLEVKTIGRRPDGRLGWDGGTPVDYVVVMRRFAQERVLDTFAEKGGLDAPLVHTLAAHIAEFHADAEIRSQKGGSAVMQSVAATTIECLRDCSGVGFELAGIAWLEDAWHAEVARLSPVLDFRRDAGKVRRCHGDLHLRNVCLLDRGPVLFDCLEFSDDLASIDVLYDLAFLLMDLIHRDRPSDANRLLNRYLDLTTEDDGLTAIPFFVSLRAAIRAHVSATLAHYGDRDAAISEAHRYLALAHSALHWPPPCLVAIGGLSGSGKSTLAAHLAPDLGPVPGARVLRSDVFRKRRFGIVPETPLPESAYGEHVTKDVYGDLCAKAAAALRGGYSAIIDAVALSPEERAAFAVVAAEAKVPFTGFWLDAPFSAMADRIRARRGDASDASVEILERQLHNTLSQLDWHRIDAGSSPKATLGAARKALR